MPSCDHTTSHHKTTIIGNFTKMKKLLFLILINIIGKNVFCQSNISLEEPHSIHQSSYSTEKWEFLKGVLKNKDIVALGESLHGVKEYNAYKLEIIKYLHEELGFNVIAIESDLAMNYYGNRYGNKIPDTLFLKNLISPVWHTENYLKLVKYIKSKPNLKIIGFDIVNINSINSGLSNLSINNEDQVNKNDKIFIQYSVLNKLYKSEEHFYNGYRDSIMAKNIEWIVEELYPNEKIIISAANIHIAKTKVNKHGYMGEILSKKYKEKYFSIGFFHSLGDPTNIYRDVFYRNELSKLPNNSLQRKLLNYQKNNLFIDSNKLKRNERNSWIDSEIEHIFKTGKYKYKINISKSFDAIIWIKEVTHPTYIIESKYHYTKKKNR